MVFDENGKDLHMDKTETHPSSDLVNDPIIHLTNSKKCECKIYIPKHPIELIWYGVISILVALFFIFTSPDMCLVKAAIVSNSMIPVDSIIDFIILNLVNRGKIADDCLANSARLTNKYRWTNTIFTVVAAICIITEQLHPAIAISSIIIMIIQILYARKNWN